MTSPASAPPTRREPVAVSWSGGKDSALALAALAAGGRYEPVALLTSITTDYDRVSIHGVRRALLEAQAAALGLPLYEIALGTGPSNAAYEAAFAGAVSAMRARHPNVQRIAFGDLFLADVRAYRERQVAALGLDSLFPLWGQPTDRLAREFVAAGYAARLVCVDTTLLPASFAGRSFDAALLEELPPSVDPCGERGEFHTFVSAGPLWPAPIPCRVGEIVLRDARFAYCDLVPT